MPGKVFQKATEFKVFGTKFIFFVVNVKKSNLIVLDLPHLSSKKYVLFQICPKVFQKATEFKVFGTHIIYSDIRLGKS